LGYRDFLFDNCALSADLFRRTGGFDPSFHRLEGCEYGLRLLEAGARLVYVPDALAVHHDTSDLPQSVERIREEGAARVQLACRHPILRRVLFSAPGGLSALNENQSEERGARMERRDDREYRECLREERRSQAGCPVREVELDQRGQATRPRGMPRVIQLLAFGVSGGGDGVTKLALQIIAGCEKLKLRRHRNALVNAVTMFNYWRGVAAATGSRAAFWAWAAEGPDAAFVAADAPVFEWTARPAGPRLQELMVRGSRQGIRVLVDGIELDIPPEPWAEPLRIEHIELAVSRLCAERVVPALMPTAIKGSAADDRPALSVN
jgi:hypothetical protein